MNARFTNSMLALTAAGLLGMASAFAGGPGNGSCDGSGDGICDSSGDGPAGNAQMQRRGGPADRMAHMANQLNLSLEQQKALLDLFDLQAQDREQLRNEIVGQFGGELCAMRDQHRAEVRALLNDDQLALHGAMLQERDKARSEGRGGFGPLECPSDG